MAKRKLIYNRNQNILPKQLTDKTVTFADET